jgi:hypothetical protein
VTLMVTAQKNKMAGSCHVAYETVPSRCSALEKELGHSQGTAVRKELPNNMYSEVLIGGNW